MRPNVQALFDACQRGDADKLDGLLVAGEDVNVAGTGGVTPLMAACMRGKEECVCTIPVAL